MTKDDRQKEMEAGIEALSDEIRKIKAEADKAGADTRQRMYEEVRRLEEQESEAREHMRKMRESSAQAIEDMVAGTERAWKALADSVDQARKRFLTGSR